MIAMTLAQEQEAWELINRYERAFMSADPQPRDGALSWAAFEIIAKRSGLQPPFLCEECQRPLDAHGIYVSEGKRYHIEHAVTEEDDGDDG